ncbi:MAG: hypothetical protein MUO36_02140 [Candidatus Hadarchaeum sp.]|nr:hypothetical protein [Candidatus Hadarchaeum sp.]
MTDCFTTEWLTAIGTNIAVVAALAIAIFHEHLRRLFWHPTLEIRLDNQPPDCNLIPTNLQTGTQVDCYYFRIRIHNEGRASAETVEVFIEEIHRRRADGTFGRWQNFLPLNLVWAHYQQPYFPKIPPKVYKHCDLGHIFDPTFRNQIPGEDHPALGEFQSQTVMCLALIVRPNSGTHLIPPGFYRLTLVAVAANAKVTRRTIEMNLTGQWFPDESRMLREGIGLRLL